MLTDSCGLMLLALLCLVWLAWTWSHGPSFPSRSAAVTARVQRLLKPRTPDDCPRCHQQATAAGTPPARRPVPPWRDHKSRRGAPKRIATQGVACPNHMCASYRITDAQIHARVGDGAHGQCARIQTLRWQACNTTFSTRRDTPLYRLKTASQRVALVLTALAEGLSISAAGRVFGHRHATITTWVTRAGQHSATLHDRIFRGRYRPHIQFDELRTRVRCRAHMLWLWVAGDPLSKLIPVLHRGPRTQDAAHRVVHDLWQRRATGCLPVFTSDGLHRYFSALTAHFGQWVTGAPRRARQWQVAAGRI